MTKKKTKTKGLYRNEKERREAEKILKRRAEIHAERANEKTLLTSLAQRRLHGLLNAVIVFSMLNLIVAVIFCLVAFFIEGNFLGYPTNLVMRGEGMIALVSAVLLFFINMKGFHWLYDCEKIQPFFFLQTGLLLASLVSFFFVSTNYFFEPISFINIVLLAASLLTTWQICTEPTTSTNYRLPRHSK